MPSNSFSNTIAASDRSPNFLENNQKSTFPRGIMHTQKTVSVEDVERTKPKVVTIFGKLEKRTLVGEEPEDSPMSGFL